VKKDPFRIIVGVNHYSIINDLFPSYVVTVENAEMARKLRIMCNGVWHMRDAEIEEAKKR